MSKSLAIAFICLLLPSAALAQDVPAASPPASVKQRVGLTDFSIEYSSPAVKKRKVWGELVPYDKLWRTGANAATKLTASRDFTFGDKPVKAGSYALYTIPGKAKWTVILNTNWQTGGTQGYDEKNDVARITVTPAKSGHRERMTFLFSDATDDTASLDLEWEKLRVRIPLAVDTRTQTQASIDQAVDNAWRPHFVAARWLLDSGGDLAKALGYIDQSIAIKATWWNHWIKAQILGKQGKNADALAAAEKAQELGKGDQVFEGFFKADVEKAAAGWKKK